MSLCEVDGLDFTATQQSLPITSPLATSPARSAIIMIAVLVIDSDEGTRKSEYFSEGDEDGVVNLAQGRSDEACYQKQNSKPAQTYC